tara:strand:+ start:84 stop:1157 length:1074 start_codon:yes stop_codon:yes gene_type:complete
MSFFKSSILTLLVISSSFLLAYDCYVLKGADSSIADGSEQYPFNDIQKCFDGGPNQISDNNPTDIIYVGPGTYEVCNLNIGRNIIKGAGINSTILVSKQDGCQYLFNCEGNWDEGNAEISGITFQNSEQNWYPSVNYITSQASSTKIYNCLFNDYRAITLSSSSNIRNNIFNTNGTLDMNANYNYFMNNLILKQVTFSLSNLPGNSDINTAHFHNNIFLSGCGDFPSNGIDNFSYNLQLRSYEQINGYQYGNDGYSCGELGPSQDIEHFFSISDLDFLAENWNLYNVFAIGENSILFDAGHPSSEFNDLDGSRGDIGIHAGMHPLTTPGPVIIDFNVDPIIVPIDGQINVNARAVTE